MSLPTDISLPRPPSLHDWAAAICGYIVESYAMEAFEAAELTGAVGESLAAENINPAPVGLALPLRVREQITSGAEFARTLAARSLTSADAADLEPLYVDPAVWADFACRYLEYSEVISSPQGLLLWQRLSLVFDSFELGERPVVFLSVPLQQSLPLDGVRPAFDVSAVL